MIRKPKIKNWLKLIFIYAPIALAFIWGFYHQFYKSYPEIHEPAWQLSFSPNVSVPIVETSTPEVVGADTVTLIWNKPDIKSENDIDRNKKERLESEIANLELEKKNLEENILKLKKDNARLSKLSYDMQEAIIRFVEKNRVRDMLASALVGAIISVIFTYILTRPEIRRAIDDWFWKELGEKKINS